MQLLDDKSNIHDQGIANNALIYFKLRKGSIRSLIQIQASGRTYRKLDCDSCR